MENLLGPMWSGVTPVVSVDETTIVATVGKFFLGLEIYKPAM